MIEQFAYYVGKTPVEQSEIDNILNYPDIEVTNQIVKDRYMIIFKHEKVVTKHDFNLKDNWIIAENKTYEFDLDANNYLCSKFI